MPDFELNAEELKKTFDTKELKSVQQDLRFAYENDERAELYSRAAELLMPQVSILSMTVKAFGKEDAVSMFRSMGSEIRSEIEDEVFPFQDMADEIQSTLLKQVSMEFESSLVRYNIVRAKLDQGKIEELVDVRMKEHARTVALLPRAFSDLEAICCGFPDAGCDFRDYFRDEFKKFQTMSYEELKEDHKRISQVLPVQTFNDVLMDAIKSTGGAQVAEAIDLFARETPVEKVVDVLFRAMAVGEEMGSVLVSGERIPEDLKKEGMKSLTEIRSILESGWNALCEANPDIAAGFDKVLEEARANARDVYQSPYVSGSHRPGPAASDKQNGIGTVSKRDCSM